MALSDPHISEPWELLLSRSDKENHAAFPDTR